MLNLNNITKLMAVWGKAPLKINPTQCLPLRYPKSVCKLCVDNCPAMAIEIKQAHIGVIDDQCTGCGICFNLCPTGVFDMTNFDSHTFVEQAQQFVSKDKNITIECSKVPFECSSHESLRLPCLAHIMPSLVLKLISLGSDEITIRDAGICEVCESKSGDKIAKDTIFKTQELLKNLGFKQKISIITDGISINNLAYEGERLKDYKDEPDISRRQIFSMFNKEVKKGVAGIIKKEPPLKIDGKEKLTKALPKEREELLEILKGASLSLRRDKEKNVSKKGVVLNTSIFPGITIKDGCDMCQLCCLFCPTDALIAESTEKGQGIVFNTAACTACNMCVDVCAQGVLTLKVKETLLDVVIKEKKTNLIWFDRICCSNCGRVFTKKTTEDICDICLKEKEM